MMKLETIKQGRLVVRKLIKIALVVLLVNLAYDIIKHQLAKKPAIKESQEADQDNEQDNDCVNCTLMRVVKENVPDINKCLNNINGALQTIQKRTDDINDLISAIAAHG